MKDALTLAIDAGGTYFKAALITAGGEICPESRRRYRVDSEGSAESIHAAYRGLIREQLRTAADLELTVGTVVVDTPGPFDFAGGRSLMQHKFQAICGIPLIPWIREEAGELPVHFLHDSTAFLLGEHWKGNLQGFSDAAGVMLGTGLGFAYMQGGEVQLNPTGGPACSLFRSPYGSGTAEDAVSRRGILRRYCERAADACPALDVADIAGLAGEGEPAALLTFAETGRMLGEILLPVLREKGSRALAVGGQISKAWPYFGQSLQEALAPAGLERIAPSADPDDAHFFGCAWQARK